MIDSEIVNAFKMKERIVSHHYMIKKKIAHIQIIVYLNISPKYVGITTFTEQKNLKFKTSQVTRRVSASVQINFDKKSMVFLTELAIIKGKWHLDGISIGEL